MSEMYEPVVVNYARQRKRNRDVDSGSKEEEERYGQYLNIPTKKQVRALSRKQHKGIVVQYHDQQGRVYIPISLVSNKEQIKSILWLSNRFQSTDYDPSTDLFFFVVAAAAPKNEKGARENLVVDNQLTLYTSITHDVIHKGKIKDIYMVNKKNVVSIVMIQLDDPISTSAVIPFSIAQERSLGTAQ